MWPPSVPSHAAAGLCCAGPSSSLPAQLATSEHTRHPFVGRYPCLNATPVCLPGHAVPFPRLIASCGDLITFRWEGALPQTVAAVMADTNEVALGEWAGTGVWQTPV